MVNFYEKISNYALDVSKYVLTGVVITTFFRSFDDKDGLWIYLIGLLVAIFFLGVSFFSYSEYIKRENHKKNNKKGGKK